jgi:alpha-aminoadipate carrier protein LysW
LGLDIYETQVYNFKIIKFWFGGIVMSIFVNCVVCEGKVKVSDELMEGEIITCPDCGSELEVISLDPLTVVEAPEVQEDWGE